VRVFLFLFRLANEKPAFAEAGWVGCIRTAMREALPQSDFFLLPEPPPRIDLHNPVIK
jgi:hypothetical protein